MLLIRSPFNDPYLNIAAEEFLLKNFKDDIFFIYINDRSVIVGKHQNVYAETDIDFLEENKIPVIRRLSGGGAVFHDNGNINFCFITAFSGKNENFFRKYTGPVMRMLRKYGLEPEYSSRNDLLLSGRKFSGNAQHIIKNKIMHHGTILFSTDLNMLSLSLKQPGSNYTGFAVRSVRTPVVNVSDFIEADISDIKMSLIKEVEEENINCSFYDFSETEKLKIISLAEEKYRQWEWNYAYSPQFSFSTKIMSGEKPISVEISVLHGRISDMSFSDESERRYKSLCDSIIGMPYRKDILAKALMNIRLSDYFNVSDNEEFLKKIF